MVRINRVHGYRERLHQIESVSTLERNQAGKDCLMQGGHCDCKVIDQCPFTKKDGEDNG